MVDVCKSSTSMIRTKIREGKIPDAARKIIRVVLAELEERHPNSWDRNFCEEMLVHGKKISKKQGEHLERILDDELLKIEYPDGVPKGVLGF